MTATTPTHVATSIPEVWSAKTMRVMLRKGFWSRFTGSPMSGACLIQHTELVGGPGDLIHIQVTNPLAGAGVDGDTATLEGNEENLATSEIQVATTLHRHAVLNYRRSQKKSIVDLRNEGHMRLAEWGAAKIDALRFAAYVSTTNSDVPDGNYDSPNTYVVGTGTTIDDVAATDKLTVDAVRTLRYKLEDQEAQPFDVNGLPVYFLVATPEMAFDLKNDADYDAAVKDAGPRDLGGNPIFTGALAMIDGVVILPHFRTLTATNATSVRVAKALAFGREAFVEGLDEAPFWEEDTFDYGNKLGTAYGFASGHRRGLERNSIQVYAASTKPV